MRELNILFVNSIDENLIDHFRESEQIKDYFDLYKFKASKKEILLVPKQYLKNEKDTVLVSIDDSLSKYELCELGSKVKKIIPFSCTISYLFNFEEEADVEQFTLGLILSGYKFEKYIESDPEDIVIQFDEAIDTDEQNFIKESIYFVRDLVNLPALDKTPEYFIDNVKELINNEKIKLKIFDKEWLLKENFGGVIGVSQGSSKNPYFLVGEYNTDADFQISLIGKGVLFDSGGLSLKSPSGMETMKTDMAGAATAWAVIKLVSSLGLNIGLKVYTPLVENMPSSTAIRPGDVLKMRNGKTIEVLNTDAEGRLVLCDVLTYIGKFNPKVVIDTATLTGAVIVALGNVAAGVMGNDQKLIDKILEAGQVSGEKAWQLPMWDEYQSYLDSNFADIANIAPGRAAGTIEGACFISRFTEDYRWAHVDIAGVADIGDGPNKGSTGKPVGMLFEYVNSNR